MSIGTMSRWTIIGHHVCHGGFDKCSEGKYNRFKFGVGSVVRRCRDWLDWMLVEAWNMEHNQLHHYHLGEEEDPDLVEFNLAMLRKLPLPRFFKYLVVAWDEGSEYLKGLPPRQVRLPRQRLRRRSMRLCRRRRRRSCMLRCWLS